MGDLSKLLDTLIKAPLWAFLAITLGLTAPLLPLAALQSAGLNPQIKILGVPVALLTILAWSLFAASAVARLVEGVAGRVAKWREKSAIMRRYTRLPKNARLILSIVEEHQLSTFNFKGSNPAIRALRDAGLIERESISPYDASIVSYATTLLFQADLIYHKALLRPLLREAWDADSEAFVRRWQEEVRGAVL